MRFSAVVQKIIPYHMYECVKLIIINYLKINNALKNISIRISDVKQKVERLNYVEYEDIVKFYVSEKLHQKQLDEAYKPGADWEIILNKTWSSFKGFAYKNEIEKCSEFLDNFFRYKIMEGFWGETINGLHEKRRIMNFKAQLVAWIELNQHKKKPINFNKLNFPMVGNPWGFKINDIMVIEPSMEYEFYAEYILNLIAGIKNPKVLEIGGGFGGLAYYLKSKNKKINYYATDLPENLILQKYFLSSCFKRWEKIKLCQSPEDVVIGDFDGENGCVKLLPNYLIDSIPDNYFDLIINFRSFSEMPRITSDKYIKEASRLSKYLIYHENLYTKRRGVLHGISSEDFAEIDGFKRKYKRFSVWPRYGRNSAYPCAEYLYEKTTRIISSST